MTSIKNLPVLITGASTGIGYETTKYLAEKGIPVYAGVRKESDFERLNQIENVMPVKLDVTKQEQIEDTKKVIEKEGKGLWALVNNAGIAVGGALVDVPIDLVHQVLNVNVLGPLRMVQSMFDFLVETQGRIVNISSVSGRFASPFLGPYSMSKFALEAFSDSLRRELRPHKVKVIVVQPGPIKTPIWEKSTQISAKPTHPLFKERATRIGKGMVKRGLKKGDSPAKVVKKIYHALYSKRPKIRYLVTNNRLELFLGEHMPTRMVDWVLDRM